MSFKDYIRESLNQEYIVESKIMDILKTLVDKIPFLKKIIDLKNVKKTLNFLLNKIGDLTEEEFEKAKANAIKISNNPNDPNITKEFQGVEEGVFSGLRKIQKIIFATVLIMMIAGITKSALADINHNNYSAKAQQSQQITGGDSGDQPIEKIPSQNWYEHIGKKETVKKVNIDGTNYIMSQADTKATSYKDEDLAVEKAKMQAYELLTQEYGDGTFSGVGTVAQHVTHHGNHYTAVILLSLPK